MRCDYYRADHTRFRLAVAESLYAQHKGRSSQTFYCTAMLLHNLMQPEWVSIPCKRRLLSDLLCHNTPLTIEQTTSKAPNTTMCPSRGFLSNRVCFSLKWVELNRNYQTICNVSEALHFIFDTIPEVMPVILDCSILHHVIKFQNILSKPQKVYLSVFEYQYAFVVLRSKMKALLSGQNIFQCNENEYVSRAFVCDGSFDCHGVVPLDEADCAAVTTVLNMGNRKHCSQWFMLPVRNKCHSLTPSFASTFSVLPTWALTTKSAEEGILFSSKHQVYSNGSFNDSYCLDRGLVPCTLGKTACYEIFHACVFRLNVRKQLSACRQGEHLQSCKYFECNNKFKCPGHYCISFNYTCDGKWDCPRGLDEFFQDCGKRLCVNMFKCRKASLCLHVAELCDDEHQCPSGDDEHFCSLWNVHCPQSCECVLFSMRCRKVSMGNIFSQRLPFLFINLSSCYFPNHMALIEQVTIVHLVVTKSNLTDTGLKAFLLVNLLALDASENWLKHISTSTFTHAVNVKVIFLDQNLLNFLCQGTFSKLNSLKLLNLSNNHLLDLSHFCFQDISTLSFLSLKNISAKNVSVHTFKYAEFRILETDEFLLCCLIPSNVHCSTQNLQGSSCPHLLQTVSVKITFYCISFVVFSLNVASIALLKHLSAKKAYLLTTLSVNIVDLLCSFPLIIIWIADIVLRDNHLLQAEKWTSSAACFASYFLSSLFAILSPPTLCLLSLSRLMIVVHPVDTKFKETHFVMKNAARLFALGLFLSASLTAITSFLFQNLPSELCSPFIDPAGTNFVVLAFTCLCSVVQSGALVSILVMYTKIFLKLHRSKEALKESVSKMQSNGHLFAQLVITASSDIVCWLPSNTIYLVCLLTKACAPGLPVWATIALATINSVMDPLMFLISFWRTASSSRAGAEQKNK